ncbi:hypothetical protein KAFR_0D00160 [Kazachstania africana CBS 2517]|uniref:Antisense of depressing factor protein 1 n=1 Tax=Kazachstania africana (strain ATCC 22294 / BCRC 22015 / CBS 2517 / CECT 1963 / NBRC 1671 / NRRL Y-8276) TaxID=1071382 RepID=H2ATG2_KAZAF|nr:hypothetical protein KAFR_0D00160 [Kazachstania africana CBS 2517]CCF57662.1 hypothetical protein KAFR_0D00160 [Kazachstania africana CBS 2517]
MGKSKTARQAGGNRIKKIKSRKNVISQSERKKNKLIVEKFNQQTITNVQELNKDLKKDKRRLSKTKNALETKKLLHDQARDHEVKQNIETKLKETEDSMLKQIEMISGFSL